MTAADLVRTALRKLTVIDLIDDAPAEMASVALTELNTLLDNWNAERRAVYADTWLTNTITGSLSPHTIGSSGGTWTTTHRPVSIEAAFVSVSSLWYPITIRPKAWYDTLIDTTDTATYPTDLYYEAAWPLGKLYLYPIPTAAYSVRLSVRTVLSALTLVSTFTMPPGYEDAVRLSLAKKVAPYFGAAWTAALQSELDEALARVFPNNRESPVIGTTPFESSLVDPGGFDFYTRGYL